MYKQGKILKIKSTNKEKDPPPPTHTHTYTHTKLINDSVTFQIFVDTINELSFLFCFATRHNNFH